MGGAGRTAKPWAVPGLAQPGATIADKHKQPQATGQPDGPRGDGCGVLVISNDGGRRDQVL